MTGLNIIEKLGSRFYKFDEDKRYKKRGGRISTKHYARIAKRKLMDMLQKEIQIAQSGVFTLPEDIKFKGDEGRITIELKLKQKYETI